MKKMLMISLMLVCRLSVAEAQPDVQVLDQVCLAKQAQQCLETVMPAQVPVINIFPAVTCPPGYTPAGGPPNYACARSLKETAGIVPAMQACDLEARIHPSDSCVRTLPLGELITTVRDDMRLLLRDFCMTYKTPAEQDNCKVLNLSPGAAAAASAAPAVPASTVSQ